ncbi:MAG TPA: hypothetical protein VFK10_09685 [Burkholderiaceae bacterium]|nr:hypothetical protein [Burkholderiaceae bacterium]
MTQRLHRGARRASALALLALAGCSGVKTYPNDLAAKNLSIRTATASGSAFSSVRAELDVHSVDASCHTQYVGTVELDRAATAVGIPADRGSYLVFNFLSSSFLGGERGRITRAMFIQPRADQRYEIDVTYRDNLYDVVLRERPPRGTAREVPLLDLNACAKARPNPNLRS